jgi:hypothetical protein
LIRIEDFAERDRVTVTRAQHEQQRETEKDGVFHGQKKLAREVSAPPDERRAAATPVERACKGFTVNVRRATTDGFRQRLSRSNRALNN